MTLARALWGCAGVLGVFVALAHSIVGERYVFRPLRAGAEPGAILRHSMFRRLFWAFWHFPSMVWFLLGVVAMGAACGEWSMDAWLYVAIAIFGASGLVNLWAVRRLHVGWVLLFSAAALLAGGEFLQS